MLLHVKSHELYPVSFLSLQPYDVKQQIHNWDEAFDWTVYFGQPGVEVYKMLITGNDVIQGAIALERKEDHVYIHLIESAPNNRYDKEFDLIGEHLVAFACKRSMDIGYDGLVAFRSKTRPRLLAYYIRDIHAQHIGGGHMIISESVAEELIMLYLS
ncbi:hypothetical protein [Paenibacillus sp. GP183]|uniref:hypothetical protein n=1 Tax=Paenibacillus sp. GP183 TaxID=1882751 RepID=UPI000896C861|nr:hypothetical protein [Paenibacillus sp. GP183]SED10304.1 hypothetical protein SAMN05443246_5720 [Paenibacillus sp. GP183]